MDMQRLKSILPSLVGVALLLASIWVLHREFQHYSIDEIWHQLTRIPKQQVVVAIALTCLNLLVFTGYDTLSVSYIHHPLPYIKTALGALTSIPIGNALGFSLLSGTAVRYRLYSSSNISTLQIAQIVTFCHITFWLGLFVVGGIFFVWHPITIPRNLMLPFVDTRPLGAAFLGLIGGYGMWNWMSGRSLSISKFVIPHISPHLSLLQTLVGSLDWALAASVFYALLPETLPETAHLPYPTFVGIYLFAQFAGVVSNVPGGLGVFETVMIWLLAKSFSSATLLGTLLAYRAIYYLLPLMIAVILLGAFEVKQRLR
ncbi:MULTISPECIES: lysylphosphatidylglycerol synthase domain-containing protein [unclassified Leptolyngbya]|uniref:lysylphosphatidylglycerol synthase domain-containing protein n=1 Tax=unclassified Leptolyngbya TaxID=2650499 RepID=UPI0016883EAE|nr:MULTISPECIES: lysylphosphatidylglycerol synthase domain-containing protein [unclassified Leptolyngbya]MBD1911839.1 UPF0104 family protein [Leptolyngbya sp. FACHB-8]MBD2158208.1 UPF0104 family protein [Leptolyngbya sp. FACHB-16]